MRLGDVIITTVTFAVATMSAVALYYSALTKINLAHASDAAVRCLALNAYHEARGEGLVGMVAVSRVVLNRVRDPRWSDDVCGVVFEPSQFSWTRTLAPGWRLEDNPPEREAWNDARDAARIALDGRITTDVEGATCYHAVGAAPAWAPRVRRIATIGRHVFYAC